MNDTLPPEADTIPPVPPIELDADAPPIDHIIANFDTALNEFRAYVERLPVTGTSKALNCALAGFTAQQAFMREVRRLLGDIL